MSPPVSGQGKLPRRVIAALCYLLEIIAGATEDLVTTPTFVSSLVIQKSPTPRGSYAFDVCFSGMALSVAVGTDTASIIVTPPNAVLWRLISRTAYGLSAVLRWHCQTKKVLIMRENLGRKLTQLDFPQPASSQPTGVLPLPQASAIASLSLRSTQSPSYLKQFWPFDPAKSSMIDFGLESALFTSFRVAVDSIRLPSRPV